MKYWLLAILVQIVFIVPVQALAQTRDVQSTSFTDSHTFFLTGYGFTNVVKPENSSSDLGVGFNPLVLWKLQDKALFEAEAEIELVNSSTEITLEYAQLLYFANRFVTFGAGKFLSPNNVFMERLHPAWINKFPDNPLGLSGHGGTQIIAGTQIGLQFRGGIPVGPTKLNYAVYASNGPELRLDEDQGEGEEGEEHGHAAAGGPGSLDFSGSSDLNGNKAFGGRVGLFPVPQLDVGYSFETAEVSNVTTGFDNIRGNNHVVDLSYLNQFGFLKGAIDLRGQYVWLDIGNPSAPPLNFDNKSRAGYGQLAYRPTLLNTRVLPNFEAVVRYDEEVRPPDAPSSQDITRWSFGLNYWLMPSTIVRGSYQYIRNDEQGLIDTEYRWLAQFAMGF